MTGRQLNRRRRRPYRTVAATLSIAAVLIVAGLVLVHSGGSTPVPAPSASAASPLESAGTETGPSGSASASPTPPGTPGTPAPSYRLVESCDPKSVPGSIAVSAPSATSFTLHVPILMYHRIVPPDEAGNSSPGLVVPPDTFSAQLDAIEAEGWHSITMATLANDLLAHREPPARSFVITIDDGWEDGYTYALPILRKHGFIATYFVIGSRIDSAGFLTTSDLQALVAAGDEIGDHTMDHVDLEKLPASTLRYEIDAAAARIAQVTGRWPESFAYPSGGLDASDAAAVAACGVLRSGVVEEPEPAAKPGETDKPMVGVPVALETSANRFAIPRVRITPNTNPYYLAEDLKILSGG